MNDGEIGAPLRKSEPSDLSRVPVLHGGTALHRATGTAQRRPTSMSGWCCEKLQR